jgi:plasmid stabilization system protein ParE
MRKLVTRLQAQLDVEEATSWYENRRPGLGLRFLEELEYVLKRVTAAPLQFPAIHPGVRRALLNRFPYSVYFLAGDEEVEIIAVLHQHRHPDTWRSRF